MDNVDKLKKKIDNIKKENKEIKNRITLKKKLLQKLLNI
jgi:hypothetical protein